MKKKLCSIFVSIFLILSMGISTVFADDGSRNSEDDLRATAVIEIFDSETGEVETYEEVLPISTFQSKGTRSGETIYTVEAKVNLGDYIQPRVTSAEKTETYNDVKVTAGMNYLNRGNTYKATKLYGDIEFPSSLYYAEQRHWIARDTSIINNPSCCSEKICPTKNDWSYNTTCTEYEYIDSSTPPFVRYSARIRVRDMSAYMDVSVTCKLEFT